MATRKWMQQTHGKHHPLNRILAKIHGMTQHIAKQIPSQQVQQMMASVKHDIEAVYQENSMLHEVSATAVATIAELYGERYLVEQVLISIAEIVGFKSRQPELSIKWHEELCEALRDIHVATSQQEAAMMKKKGRLVILMASKESHDGKQRLVA